MNHVILPCATLLFKCACSVFKCGDALDNVFVSLVISRINYALPGFAHNLSKDDFNSTKLMPFLENLESGALIVNRILYLSYPNKPIFNYPYKCYPLIIASTILSPQSGLPILMLSVPICINSIRPKLNSINYRIRSYTKTLHNTIVRSFSSFTPKFKLNSYNFIYCLTLHCMIIISDLPFF